MRLVRPAAAGRKGFRLLPRQFNEQQVPMLGKFGALPVIAIAAPGSGDDRVSPPVTAGQAFPVHPM